LLCTAQARPPFPVLVHNIGNGGSRLPDSSRFSAEKKKEYQSQQKRND
jgi:hypothetical protein